MWSLLFDELRAIRYREVEVQQTTLWKLWQWITNYKVLSFVNRLLFVAIGDNFRAILSY